MEYEIPSPYRNLSWEEIVDPQMSVPAAFSWIMKGQGQPILGYLVQAYRPGRWRHFTEQQLNLYDSTESANHTPIHRYYNLVLPLTEDEKQVLLEAAFADQADAEQTISKLRPEIRDLAKQKILNWVNRMCNYYIDDYLASLL